MDTEQHLQEVGEVIRKAFGEVDTSGVELANLIRIVANQYELLANLDTGSEESLSAPRWGLLVRLMGEEQLGKTNGVTPTYLSRCQRVSKNTISALLRGLEEQGLIERRLDENDRRHFRICLSESGRTLVRATAPQQFNRLNAFAGQLSLAERQELKNLLVKLHLSLLTHGGVPPELQFASTKHLQEDPLATPKNP